MADSRAHILVAGRVQGVGFRDFTARVARGLALVGRVRNRPDRRVEVEVEGERGRIEALVTRIGQGPPGSRVDDVSVEWGAPLGAWPDFRIDW
jgi:acylphosphatase